MEWVSLNVDDWITGVEDIEPETEYVYFRIVMRLYQLDGALLDNDQANARRCRVSTHSYRRHKQLLIDAGKLEQDRSAEEALEGIRVQLSSVLEEMCGRLDMDAHV